jgi:hypothetical protein
VSISIHSPGRVDDSEHLARLVFEPKHVGPDGAIEVGALREISDNGLSLQRRRENDSVDLAQMGHRIMQDQNNRSLAKAELAGFAAPSLGEFVGIVEFPAGMVRKHESADKRAFCVMDSAQEANPLHADIITNGQWSKTARSKLRNELRQLLLDPKPAMP